MDMIREGTIELLNGWMPTKELNGSIDNMLSQYKKSQLENLAMRNGINVNSKKLKQDIIDELKDNFINKENIINKLKRFNEEESQVIRSVIEHDNISYISLEHYPIKIKNLFFTGICLSYYIDEKVFLVIPEEVSEIINSIDMVKFNSEKRDYDIIMKYVNAFSNLYGVYDIHYLTTMINERSGNEFSEEYIVSVIKSVIECGSHFELVDDLVVHESLFIIEGDLEELLEGIKGKPYFNPSDELIEGYNDDFFVDLTPELLKLKQYFRKTFKVSNRDDFDYCFLDIVDILSDIKFDINRVLSELNRMRFGTEKIKDIEEFIKRISKARNHTRMWVNRGFTPNELYTLHGGLKVNELEVACEGSDKVGRNDPCPCGSGKKYKKCCG